MEVECRYCKYLWNYNGFSIYATCPKCRTVNKVRERDKLLKYGDKK